MAHFIDNFSCQFIEYQWASIIIFFWGQNNEFSHCINKTNIACAQK